jgi:hypothetical protein
MMTPNLDERGAEARLNASRMVLLIAAILLMLPGIARGPRFILCGILFFAGFFMRFEARKRWCILRACGIKMPF